jgi:hypothetical protein
LHFRSFLFLVSLKISNMSCPYHESILWSYIGKILTEKKSISMENNSLRYRKPTWKKQNGAQSKTTKQVDFALKKVPAQRATKRQEKQWQNVLLSKIVPATLQQISKWHPLLMSRFHPLTKCF